jgi:two-component system phosphate regulon sensor histidine kinase PhoR
MASLEALPLPCIVVDASGMVGFANDRARVLLEGSHSGEPIANLLPVPDVVDAVAAARMDQSSRAVRFALLAPVQQWFEAYIAPLELETETNSQGLVLITLTDLTQQQRIERMRADFVANASHELRTPLASLLGFIETLQGPAREDAEARERFLAVMKTQAERMSRLINDLLSLSRVEVNAHVRPQGRIDLREVVSHVTDGLAPLARENGVVVAVDISSEPLAVQGDWDELVRAVENLVENAIKYGAAGKRVEIKAHRFDAAPPQATVAVTDFGPGIPPEHLPRLTERFYRTDVADSRAKGGTGLGLALVKHILARHRGSLAIESELGRGSIFTIRLDLCGPETPA